ncbi:hypothetical protein [Botrimarina mediterranea]|uniref:SLA1 homology domain-containing protein n=1 Tax=Botrimarina mediterranea TaxID=2528022 RepID=A0A518K9S8_9BACT|nr:hypothetical protein [Botrimarina mediterranea]QDV74548.1 hypothetical protein Spa11_27520 [Botrimarina mediterranea]QDV79188.1 hypothetical protein K2D_27990 [Planctomycetes bacterium K2D]
MKRLLLTLLLVSSCPLAVRADDLETLTDDQLSEVSDGWRRQIEVDQQEADRAFVRLDRAIAMITDKPGLGEAMTLLELKEVVGLLRKLAPEVVAAHEGAVDATRGFGETLQTAAPVLAESAKRFRQYAANETYNDLRDDYKTWADFFDALATRYQLQGETTGPAVQALTFNLHYVRRTGLMLKRIDEHLNVPELDEADTERFLRRLAVYVRGFTDLRERLRVLHAKTVDGVEDAPAASEPAGSEALSADPASLRPSPGVPLATSAAHRPSGAEGFYSGVWLLASADGSLEVTVSPENGRLLVELAGQHEQLEAARGEIRVEATGASLVGLAYKPIGCDWVEVGDYALDSESEDTLSFLCPVVSGNFEEGFAATDRITRHELRRLSR